MPLRSWIKMCWALSLTVALFTALSIASLFFGTRNTEAGEEDPRIEAPTSEPPQKKETLENFQAIWEAPVNCQEKAAPKAVVPPTQVKPPSLEEDLKNYVVIKNIINSGEAVILVNKQQYWVTPRPSPPRVQKPTEKLKWDIQLPNGRQITVLKLEQRKGIKFQSGTETAYLEYYRDEEERKKKVDKEIASGLRPGHSEIKEPVLVGENHWQIPLEEQEELLDDYDAYVTELSPEEHNDPPGLIIRNVDAGSKADRYGLRANDVLQSINGVPIRSERQVRQLLEQDQQQDRIEVTIMRRSENSGWEPVKFIFEMR